MTGIDTKDWLEPLLEKINAPGEVVAFVSDLRDKNFAGVVDILRNATESGDVVRIYNLCNTLEMSINVVKLGITSPIQKIKMDDYQTQLMNIRKIANGIISADGRQAPMDNSLKNTLESLIHTFESRLQLHEALDEFGYTEEEIEKSMEDSRTGFRS